MRALKFGLLFLGIFTVLFASIGLFVPSVDFKTKIEIKKPLEYSYSIFGNPMLLTNWITGLKSIRYVAGIPFQPGCKFKMTIERNGQDRVITQELIEFESYHHISFLLEEKKYTINVRVDFYGDGENTTIVTKNTIIGKDYLYSCLAPFAAMSMKKETMIDYNKLKKLIEN